MRAAFFLTVMILLAIPAGAGVTVDHAAGTDFGSYRTYAWKAGTEAARPEVQESVVRAVDRQLSASGLRRVVDGPADLWVVTYAFANMEAHNRANYVRVDFYGVGVITSDVIGTTKGTLIVDLIDVGSDRPVWRGMATEVMAMPSSEKLRKKVDKVTRKMFKDYPPR